MTVIRQNLLASLSNLHLSVPLLLCLLLEIIPIWCPSINAQCQETQKVLLAYGVIAAANSAPVTKGN